jgi:hypothetical protein
MKLPEVPVPDPSFDQVRIRRFSQTEPIITMFGTQTPDGLERMEVWAPKNLLVAFRKIPGVASVSVWEYETRYYFILDPRYNANWVQQEVTAVALCHKPRAPNKPKTLSMVVHNFDFDEEEE